MFGGGGGNNPAGAGRRDRLSAGGEPLGDDSLVVGLDFDRRALLPSGPRPKVMVHTVEGDDGARRRLVPP